MAEFLIKARGNQWMENLAKADWSTKSLTQAQFDARGEKGDIVQVLPDKQVWWNNCPFVLIRVPELDFKKAKQAYEGALYEEIEVDGRVQQKLRKKRKFFVPATLVDKAVENKGELELKATDFEKSITERTLAVDKTITTKTVSLTSVMKE